MGARYDKYDPKVGGHRAALYADRAVTVNPLGVGLNSSGQIVVGAGNTGIIGVICATKAMLAGDIADVMTAGEITDMAGLTAGTVITANTTTGVLSNAVPSATQVFVGYTCEAARLVVRTQPLNIPATNVVGDQTGIADASTAHALNATFSDTEVETALNALGTKINAIIAALEASGLTAVV